MRKTRVLAALLCLMMIATAIPMMQATATEVGATETAANLLNGYTASVVEDFSASAGTVGYYEYNKFNNGEKVDNLTYQENFMFSTDEAKAAAGTVTVADGQLTMATGAKRENVTENSKGVAFGTASDGESAITATSYPSTKYTLTKKFLATAGKKLSFKLKFDQLGADNKDHLAQLEFFNGEYRICLLLTETGIMMRNTDRMNNPISATHTTGVTYQYLLEVEEGATEAITDDYINVWRRTSDSDSYTFLGTATSSTFGSNTGSNVVLWSRTGTTMIVDDMTLYEVSMNSVLENLDVLKNVTFPNTDAMTAFGTPSINSGSTGGSYTVANNTLQLVAPDVLVTTDESTGETKYTDKYTNYQINQTLSDGEFIRVKGTTNGHATRDGDQGVYFEFDIENPGTTTNGARLRFMAGSSTISNASGTVASVSHADNTTYDYLIQRNGATDTATYKIWRRVGTETEWTYIAEASAQSIAARSSGKIIIKTRNGAGFNVESVTYYGTAVSSDTSKKEAALVNGLTTLQNEDFSGELSSYGSEYKNVDYTKTGTRTYLTASGSKESQGTVSIEGGMLKIAANDMFSNVTTNANGGTLSEAADGYPKSGLNMTNPVRFRTGDKFSFKVKFDELGQGYSTGEPAAEIQFHTGATRMYPRFYADKLVFRNATVTDGDFTSCGHIAGITYEYLFEYEGGTDATTVTDNTIKVWRRVNGETMYTYIGTAEIDSVNDSTSMTIIAMASTTMYVDDIKWYGTHEDTTLTLSDTGVTVSRLNVTGKASDGANNCGQLILASYTGGDAPELVDVKAVSITEGTTVTFATAGLNTTGAATVRAFLWDGFGTMEPLATAVSHAVAAE